MKNESLKNYMLNEHDFLPEDYYMEDREKFQLLQKLGFLISSRRDIKSAEQLTDNDPEIWLLDKIITKEEAKFMLSFEKRRVNIYTIEQLAKKNNISVRKTQELCDHLCEVGILEFDRHNKAREKQYFIPMFVVGSGEYMLMNGKLMEEHPEIATLFNIMSQCVGPVASVIPPGGGGIGMHVIPVEKAIPAESKSVSLEHLSYWLKKYDKYAVDVCACRRQQRIRKEGVGDIEGYMCLAVGDMAEYVVETKKDAYYITYDECMEILERAEEKGFVHQITNLDGSDKIVGICNCSPGACNALRTSQLFNTPNLSASAYRAHVEAEKCVACGKCVEVCPVGAAKLGQKLCHKDGKAGYPVTVFEKEKEPGGMLRFGIPSYRLEKDVISAEIDIIKEMGAEIKCGIEVGKDITLEELRKQGYKAFFVAIGLQGGRKAGVKGENASNVETGVDFLRRINLDSSQKISGKTIVIGGGNVAIDVARTAVRAGAEKVTLVCLESPEEMPASADEIEEAKAEGISFQNGWGPKEILTKDGKATNIIFKKCVSVFDENHRFNPKYNEDETIIMDCDVIITAIGQAAVWGDLLKGTSVKVRRNGTAEADRVTLQTAEPDIFVGGDIYHGAKFAIDAIAEGKEAMVSINRYVHEGQSLTISRDLREFIELDRDDIAKGSFDRAKRQVPPVKAGNPTTTYEDLRLPLTEEQVKKEASRCLKCGATVVDENRCVGCGLCTTRCECVLAAFTLQKRLKTVECNGKPDLFSMAMLKKIALFAIPSVLQQSFVSVGNLFVQNLVNGFGSSVIAGYSAAIKINTFGVTCFGTLGNAISSFTAQNIGARNNERAKQGLRAGMVMGVIIGIPFFLGCFFKGDMLIHLFMKEGTALAYDTGIRFLKIVAPFYFVVSFKLTTDGLLRGSGALKYFMIATFGDLILRVVLGYILSVPFGPTGIWMSWPVGWIIGTLMSLAFYAKGVWRVKEE